MLCLEVIFIYLNNYLYTSYADYISAYIFNFIYYNLSEVSQLVET